MERLHSVGETDVFLRDARSAGMDDDERHHVVLAYAANPKLGAEIRGSGGIRKARFAAPGRGKRGGYRVLSLYLGPERPVYLLAVIKKTDQETFSDAEIATLARIAGAIGRTGRRG